jgi:hypothetical protein
MLIDVMLPKMPVKPGKNTESEFGWQNRQNNNKLEIDLGKENHAE